MFSYICTINNNKTNKMKNSTNYKVTTTGYELCVYANVYEVEADNKQEAIDKVLNGEVDSKECDTVDYIHFNKEQIESFRSGEDEMIIIDSVEPMISTAQSEENVRVQKLNELNLKLSRITGEPCVITEPNVIKENEVTKFRVETTDYTIVLLDEIYLTDAESKVKAITKVLNGEVERNDWNTVNHTELNDDSLQPFVTGETMLMVLQDAILVKSKEQIAEEKKQAEIESLKTQIEQLA